MEVHPYSDGQKRAVKYAVIIEKAEDNYSAYVPDLPGCISTGRTVDEAQKNIGEAIAFHLQGLREDGIPIRSPTTHAIELEVA